MSFFGRLVAGAAGAAKDITTKYIDEEIATNRAKLLADLQHQNAVKFDQYTLSPDRQKLVQDAEGGMVRARGAAQLEVDTGRETNQPYQDAKRGNKKADADMETEVLLGRARQETPILADRERVVGGVKTENALAQARGLTPIEVDRAKQLTPIEIQRAAGIADAQGRAQAKYREPKETALTKMKAIEAALGRPLNETEKMKALGLLQRDPELDVQTVTTEVIGDDGTVTKTTRKETRRPGAAAGGKPDDIDARRLAAMEAARANKSGGAAPATIAPSPIAGRPYLQVPNMKLGEMLRGKVSSNERREILEEIERRKKGDIQ